jgi:protein transport protein SEC13
VFAWTQNEAGSPWKKLLIMDFKVPVWRVSWSVTGNILAVSDGNHTVTLWKEQLDGTWAQIQSVQ